MMLKKMVMLRRLSQAFFLILFIYILWSNRYPFTGLIKPDILFKIDPFIIMMVSLGSRVLLSGAVISIVMLAIALIVGRYFCGWVCPLGTAIDMTAAVKKRHIILPDKSSAALRKVKFYLLGIFFLMALAGAQAASIFDPLVIASRFVSMHMIPALTHLFNASSSVRVFYFAHSPAILILFLIISAASLAVRRLWCRLFCPLGAIYSLIGRLSPLRRSVDGCAECGNCRNSCRMGAIKEDFSYTQGECILCMDCIYDCPKRITRFTFFGSRRPS